MFILWQIWHCFENLKFFEKNVKKCLKKCQNEIAKVGEEERKKKKKEGSQRFFSEPKNVLLQWVIFSPLHQASILGNIYTNLIQSTPALSSGLPVSTNVSPNMQQNNALQKEFGNKMIKLWQPFFLVLVYTRSDFCLCSLVYQPSVEEKISPNVYTATP